MVDFLSMAMRVGQFLLLFIPFAHCFCLTDIAPFVAVDLGLLRLRLVFTCSLFATSASAAVAWVGCNWNAAYETRRTSGSNTDYSGHSHSG